MHDLGKPVCGTTVPTNGPARRFAVPARRSARLVARWSERIPVVKALVAAAYQRYFAQASGHIRLFDGVYPDFAAAAKAVPACRSSTYDDEQSAKRVLDEWQLIWPYDYPVMFWLSQVLADCRLLFDWGGNVGLKFFAYRRYLKYRPDLTWLVNDVPAVVELGTRIARENDASALRFTTSLDALSSAHVLLAMGSLHFIDDPFGRLREAGALPPHVILSKIPAYALPAAVTLQNMGTAICPYHLFNRDEFVAGFTELGYDLVDEWQSPDCSCVIPFHRDHPIGAYSGFYFARPARPEQPR